MQWKVDFIWWLVMTSSVGGLRRNSKALPKAKLAPRKGHGHCLVVFCPSDPLQLSESQLNHYIWEVCSANPWDALKTSMTTSWIWSTESAQFFCMTTPGSKWHNQCFKSWRNWATKLCLICHIHLTLTNWLPLLQASQELFAGKSFHNQQEIDNSF